MKPLGIHHILQQRALVTRQSARLLEPELLARLASSEEELVLDFTGVEAVTPSFFDEMLRLIESTAPEARRRRLVLVLSNFASRLSDALGMVARAHSARVTERQPGVMTVDLAVA